MTPRPRRELNYRRFGWKKQKTRTAPPPRPAAGRTSRAPETAAAAAPASTAAAEEEASSRRPRLRSPCSSAGRCESVDPRPALGPARPDDRRPVSQERRAPGRSGSSDPSSRDAVQPMTAADTAAESRSAPRSGRAPRSGTDRRESVFFLRAFPTRAVLESGEDAVGNFSKAVACPY